MGSLLEESSTVQISRVILANASRSLRACCETWLHHWHHCPSSSFSQFIFSFKGAAQSRKAFAIEVDFRSGWCSFVRLVIWPLILRASKCLNCCSPGHRRPLIPTLFPCFLLLSSLFIHELFAVVVDEVDCPDRKEYPQELDGAPQEDSFVN